VQRLEEKFPNSPRVDALYGLLLEVESKDKAREFYTKRLADDENNVVRAGWLLLLRCYKWPDRGARVSCCSSSGNG